LYVDVFLHLTILLTTKIFGSIGILFFRSASGETAGRCELRIDRNRTLSRIDDRYLFGRKQMNLIMEIRDLVSTHLPMAVVASVVIALFNIYTGEITTIAHLVIDFLLHILAIFVGFVVFDAIWHKLFTESNT